MKVVSNVLKCFYTDTTVPLLSEPNDAMFDRRVITPPLILNAFQHDVLYDQESGQCLCAFFKKNGSFSSFFPDDSSVGILQGKQQCDSNVQRGPTQGMTNVCLSFLVSEPQQ